LTYKGGTSNFRFIRLIIPKSEPNGKRRLAIVYLFSQQIRVTSRHVNLDRSEIFVSETKYVSPRRYHESPMWLSLSPFSISKQIVNWVEWKTLTRWLNLISFYFGRTIIPPKFIDGPRMLTYPPKSIGRQPITNTFFDNPKLCCICDGTAAKCPCYRQVTEGIPNVEPKQLRLRDGSWYTSISV